MASCLKNVIGKILQKNKSALLFHHVPKAKVKAHQSYQFYVLFDQFVFRRFQIPNKAL